MNKKLQKVPTNNKNQFNINLIFDMGLVYFFVSLISLLLIFYSKFNLGGNLVIIIGISLIFYFLFMVIFYFKPKNFIFKILELAFLTIILFTLQYVYFFVLKSDGELYFLLFSFTLSLIFILSFWKKAYKVHSLQRNK